MRALKVNHLKLIVPVLLVILTGCVKPGLLGVKSYVWEVGDAKRMILRNSLSPSRNLPSSQWNQTLDRVIGRIRPAAVDTCHAVGAKNCDQISRPVSILNESTINAFVNEKHKVSVYGGLLTNAASDEEIAAVLAHEYGHIFADHINRTKQNMARGALAGLLTGIAIAAATDGNVNVVEDATARGASAGMLFYSQEFELESDYYSALILERAGIDLKHGRDLMIRLARSTEGNAGSQGSWGAKGLLMATTHPANDFRVARWMSISSAIEESKRIERDAEYWSWSWQIEKHEKHLRDLALKKFLVDGKLPTKGRMARWVNPRNGHSGMMTVKKITHKKKCSQIFTQISQVDFLQGERKKEDLWFSLVSGGNWEPRKSDKCNSK